MVMRPDIESAPIGMGIFRSGMFSVHCAGDYQVLAQTRGHHFQGADDVESCWRKLAHCSIWQSKSQSNVMGGIFGSNADHRNHAGTFFFGTPFVGCCSSPSTRYFAALAVSAAFWT